jgi:hypothetical protein
MSPINEYSSANRAAWSANQLWSSSAPLFVFARAKQTALMNLGLLAKNRAIGENVYRTFNMVGTPMPSPEEPVQSGSVSINEAKLLNDVVHARVRFPQDVRRVEFRFGEDSTGAPAVWIMLVTHDDLKPSKSKIESLQRAAEEVRSVIHNESNRWPYVEIATE